MYHLNLSHDLFVVCNLTVEIDPEECLDSFLAELFFESVAFSTLCLADADQHVQLLFTFLCIVFYYLPVAECRHDVINEGWRH